MASATIPAEEVSAAPARPATVQRSSQTLIAAGTTITGSIAADGDVTIDGKVEGDVRAGLLQIGTNGNITGNVLAQTATVRGSVNGNVTARTIQLAGTGTIVGDLSHAVLIIEEGGAFEGSSRRLADPLKDTPALAFSGKAETSAPKAPADAPASKAEEVVADADIKVRRK